MYFFVKCVNTGNQFGVVRIAVIACTNTAIDSRLHCTLISNFSILSFVTCEFYL